jgi:hypothetical protein
MHACYVVPPCGNADRSLFIDVSRFFKTMESRADHALDAHITTSTGSRRGWEIFCMRTNDINLWASLIVVEGQGQWDSFVCQKTSTRNVDGTPRLATPGANPKIYRDSDCSSPRQAIPRLFALEALLPNVIDHPSSPLPHLRRAEPIISSSRHQLQFWARFSLHLHHQFSELPCNTPLPSQFI